MDLTIIGAAYSGLKFAKDALQVALGYRIEAEVRAQISAALEKLGAAQDTLFELREELFRLQGDNDRLRQQLTAHEGWEAQRAVYRLTRTEGGAVVYGSEGPPPHFACPVCFSKKSIQILQDRRVLAGVYDCPGCKAEYPVNRMQEMPMPEIQRWNVFDDP
jgi:hypothetical protein